VQRSQDISEEHRGELQKARKAHQKRGPEISGWIATRKPKSTKLAKKMKRMWYKVECIAQIKINGISLSVRTD
jgi:hypothetical protein